MMDIESGGGGGRSFGRSEFERLKAAVVAGRRFGEPFRENRKILIKELAGAHYSGNGSAKKLLVNKLAQGVGVFLRLLAPRTPKVMVRTPKQILMPFAAKMEAAINALMKTISFGGTLRKAVLEALIGVSVMKIGYGHSIYADNVDLDDLVLDFSAKRWERMGFIGHRCRCPIREVRHLFRPDAKLTPVDWTDNLEQGREKVQVIGRGKVQVGDELEPFIEFYEVWVSHLNVIVMFREEDAQPLAVNPWFGPPSGPYLLLAYTDLPGNLMPVAPAAHWLDLHDSANAGMRKLDRQMQRQKSITVVRGGPDATGSRIVKSNDGDTLRLDDPTIAPLNFPGPDATSFAFVLKTLDLLNDGMGNIDALGGLGPQSGTLGQDEMLMKNASAQIQDMAALTQGLLSDAVERLAWFIWNTDPNIQAEVPFDFELDFMGSGLPFNFRDEREGEFNDYTFSIQPYSMTPQTPVTMGAAAERVMGQYVVPLAPLLMQQGMMPNMEGFLRYLAKLYDIPEIGQLVVFSGDAESNPQPDVNMSAKSPTSRREYVRRNVSGVTPKGQTNAMVSTLMGAGVQSKETAGMLGG